MNYKSNLHQLLPQPIRLTVRLLVTSTGTRAAKLLGLASAGVSDQQRAVILDQDILDLALGGLVHDYRPGQCEECEQGIGAGSAGQGQGAQGEDRGSAGAGAYTSGNKRQFPWQSPV